jgi:hypothetical protein
LSTRGRRSGSRTWGSSDTTSSSASARRSSSSKGSARGQDPDQPPVIGDEHGADVALTHLLGDFPERVLRGDDQWLTRHHVADRRALLGLGVPRDLQAKRGETVDLGLLELDLDRDLGPQERAINTLLAPARRRIGRRRRCPRCGSTSRGCSQTSSLTVRSGRGVFRLARERGSTEPASRGQNEQGPTVTSSDGSESSCWNAVAVTR